MSKSQSWVDKHRPETLDDVQGNNSDLKDIRKWADGWEAGDQAILLVGPPGVGKTSTAECVANRLGVQTVEINASSARKTDDLRDLADQIRSVGSDGRRLILIDEVDSWHHGPSKRVLYDALDDPANPVIMTANDEWETADGLTNRAETFEFSLGVRSRKAKIREVAEAEGVDLADHELKSLSQRPGLRSAINDLQVMAQEDRPVDDDAREWDQDNEWEMLDRVLTGTPDIGSLSPPDALMWIDEVMSAEYRALELSMGYDALSRADLMLSKAQRLDYGYWKYAAAMIEETANIRQTEPYFGDEISYKAKSFPEWFRHTRSSPSDGSAEAKLYQAIKKPDDAGFQLSGNFQIFREVHLPTLRALSDEEKYELILSHGLGPEEYEALDVSESEFEDWRDVENAEQGEWDGKVYSADSW